MKTYNLLLFLLLINNMAICQSVPAYVPQNGLSGWWPFNGNAHDESGNNNHGYNFGTILTTDRFGNLNTAYNFDGISSRIEVPDAPELNCEKITLSVWVYQDAPPDGRQIIYKGDFLTAQNEEYSLNANINFGIKQFSGCQPGIGWEVNDYGQQLISFQWVHLAATYDGDTVKVYLNGNMLNYYLKPGLIDVCTGGNLRFGFTWDNYPTVFTGKIDDIGIWDRALSPVEIMQLYLGTTGLDETSSNGNFSIFPNPVTDKLTVKINPTASGIAYTLSDIYCRKIQAGYLNAGFNTINMEKFSKGVYFLNVGDVNFKSFKVVKQ
jgi:hypothetical protein